MLNNHLMPSVRGQLASAILLLVSSCLITAHAFAQQPATRPVSGPAEPPRGLQLGPSDPSKPPARMVKWFAELASTDSKTRDAAKVGLMGLTKDDLPTLRNLVEQRRPLLPSQAVVLKEIVTQMYLSGDGFDTNLNGRDGFLGIRPAEVSIGARQPEDQPGKNRNDHIPPPPLALPNQGLFPGVMETLDPNQICGIMVMERMPGFAGARSLENGDVILAIVERPDKQFRGAGDFSLAIRALGAGQKVHLDLLRQGQIIRVEVILGPRPDDAEAIPGGLNPMQKLLDRRTSEMNEYWDAQFAPLLEEGVG